MRVARLIPLLLIAALPGPRPLLAQSDEATRAWQALFADPATPAGTERRQALLEAIGHDVEALKQLIAADSTYPARKPGWQKQQIRISAEGKGWDVEFHLRIPEGYDPKKSWPLLLVAHGMGGNGEQMGGVYQKLLGPEAEKWLILAPTMPGPKGYNAQPYQQQAHLEPMMWTRRVCNVDDERIFISGYSQGGHSTWNLVTMFPRFFAGGIPMAGVPIYRTGAPAGTLYLENALATAILHRWGENDRVGESIGNTDLARAADKRLKIIKHPRYKGIEVAGAGHLQVWPKDGKDLVAFLNDHRRAPLPESYQRNFSFPDAGRGYYVEAIELLRKPFDLTQPTRMQVRPQDPPPTAEQIFHARRQRASRALFKFWVTLDRKTNRLGVRQRDIARMRFYIYDGMLDLSRPVILRFGSRAWRGEIPASASCMLQQYTIDRDAGRLLVNVVELDDQGQARIRHDSQSPQPDESE
ncbi:MAG: hypothetical protein ACLFUJ_10905 [Phycisphaerae bacterium]